MSAPVADMTLRERVEAVIRHIESTQITRVHPDAKPLSEEFIKGWNDHGQNCIDTLKSMLTCPCKEGR